MLQCLQQFLRTFEGHMILIKKLRTPFPDISQFMLTLHFASQPSQIEEARVEKMSMFCLQCMMQNMLGLFFGKSCMSITCGVASMSVSWSVSCSDAGASQSDGIKVMHFCTIPSQWDNSNERVTDTVGTKSSKQKLADHVEFIYKYWSSSISEKDSLLSVTYRG